LEQRLAPGEDDEAALGAGLRVAAPAVKDGVGQHVGGVEASAAFAIGADKVGVAEAADGARAIGLATGPQVAAGEATEHRRPSGVCALALEGKEQLFDRVAHRPYRCLRADPNVKPEA
jgi:hypothetical protein